MAQDKNKLKSFVLRVVGSGVLLLFLFRKVDLAAFKELFLNIELSFFGFSFLILFLNQIIMSFCVLLLLRAKEHQVSYRWLLWDFLMSNFLGSFVPSSLGADVIRAYSLSKRIKNPYDSISAMLMLRVFGMLLLLFLGGISLFVFFYILSSGIFGVSLLLYLLVFLPVCFMVSKKTRRWTAAILDKLKLKIVREKIEKVVDSLQEYKNCSKLLIRFLPISFLAQVNKVILSFMLAKALHIECSIEIFFIFIPLIAVFTCLPSFGGLGVRETAFVFLFSQVDKLEVPLTTILALSLSHFLLALIFALLGAVMFLVFPFFKKETAAN